MPKYAHDPIMTETTQTTDAQTTTDDDNREEMVQNLIRGNRHIIDDAAEIYETNHNNIEVRHEYDGGAVIVQLSAIIAWGVDGDVEERLDDEVVNRI